MYYGQYRKGTARWIADVALREFLRAGSAELPRKNTYSRDDENRFEDYNEFHKDRLERFFMHLFRYLLVFSTFARQP